MVFALLFSYISVLVFYVLGLDSCVIASELVFWFGCGVPFKVFLCCVVNVVTTIVISVNIRTHNNI
jgi:hypothetical protein